MDKKGCWRGPWLAQWVQHLTLNLGGMSSSPTVGIQPIKKCWNSYLISDKADLRAIKVSEIKKRHYIMINQKGSIMEKNKHIIILNMYVPNKSVKIHEAKTYKTERRNRQIYY